MRNYTQVIDTLPTKRKKLSYDGTLCPITLDYKATTLSTGRGGRKSLFADERFRMELVTKVKTWRKYHKPKSKNP